jgi:hypothetical protein
MEQSVAVDAHVFDALMPDLVGHDRRPSCFVVYMFLWRRTRGGVRPVRASHQMIADGTGLSKRAVQVAVSALERRQLVATRRETKTAAPVFTLRCHWRRRA